MRPLSLVCLGVLLILAGCTAGPFAGLFGQEDSVTVSVNNSDNVTHTFEVSVVKLPADATVRRDDGLSGEVELGRGGVTTNEPGDNHTYTAVELPDSAKLHGRYTLGPREMNKSSIEEFPRNFAVVVVIYEEDEIVSWVSSTCDGSLVFLEVTMYDYGASPAFNSEGTLF
jgi:hypothetical protein